jgi:hypothetical protein
MCIRRFFFLVLLALEYHHNFSKEHLMRSWLYGSLRFPLGIVVLAVFALVQFYDGIFTFIGINEFGMEVEANPALWFLMTHLGSVTGIIIAKALALGCGVILYLNQFHIGVAFLTGFYIAVAIAPWVFLLW